MCAGPGSFQWRRSKLWEPVKGCGESLGVAPGLAPEKPPATRRANLQRAGAWWPRSVTIARLNFALCRNPDSLPNIDLGCRLPLECGRAPALSSERNTATQEIALISIYDHFHEASPRRLTELPRAIRRESILASERQAAAGNTTPIDLGDSCDSRSSPHFPCGEFEEHRN